MPKPWRPFWPKVVQVCHRFLLPAVRISSPPVHRGGQRALGGLMNGRVAKAWAGQEASQVWFVVCVDQVVQEELQHERLSLQCLNLSTYPPVQGIVEG